jgi:ribose transport system permease protein
MTESRMALSRFLERYGIWLVVLVMMVALSFLSETFFSLLNLTNILKQNATAALLALGMFLVIITAGIDLSVGSILALGMVSSAVAAQFGVPWWGVILVGPLVGLLCGALNGIGLTLLRLPHPFIMTLGMLNIARGATNLVSGGVPISGMDPQVRYFGQAEFDLSFIQDGAGLPVSLLVVAVCTLALWVMLNATPVGRHIYAIGGNPQSARVSGINVDRVLVLVYTICGGLAGLGGLLLVGRTGSAFPNAGLGAELDAIAAVIIGGASFFGGRGTVMGCIAGVIIMGLLRNGLNLLDVSVFWQQILIGFIIVGAVYFDVVRRRASVRS